MARPLIRPEAVVVGLERREGGRSRERRRANSSAVSSPSAMTTCARARLSPCPPHQSGQGRVTPKGFAGSVAARTAPPRIAGGLVLEFAHTIDRCGIGELKRAQTLDEVAATNLATLLERAEEGVDRAERLPGASAPMASRVEDAVAREPLFEGREPALRRWGRRTSGSSENRPTRIGGNVETRIGTGPSARQARSACPAFGPDRRIAHEGPQPQSFVISRFQNKSHSASMRSPRRTPGQAPSISGRKTAPLEVKGGAHRDGGPRPRSGPAAGPAEKGAIGRRGRAPPCRLARREGPRPSSTTSPRAMSWSRSCDR